MGILRSMSLLIILGLLLLGIVLYGSDVYHYAKELYDPEARGLIISGFGINMSPDKSELANLSSEIKQFYPNMRFNKNQLSYSIENNCGTEKRDRFIEAIGILQEQTILKFYEAGEDKKADIFVSCSQSSEEDEGKRYFIAGEGGPTSVVNSTVYPIILSGKIILYKSIKCDRPITELHELFHVFGFDHVNDKTKIMYPYADCNQEIDDRLITILNNLYSIEPVPEIYFNNISAIKFGNYMNFSVEIRNDGMIPSNNVTLQIYSSKDLVDSFDLGQIDFGASTTFKVGNMRLPSRKDKLFNFKLELEQEEFNKNNNEIELRVAD